MRSGGQTSERNALPCIAVELAALVDAEDEVDLLACPEGLVQDPFVVALRGPQTRIHAQVQIELPQKLCISTYRR